MLKNNRLKILFLIILSLFLFVFFFNTTKEQKQTLTVETLYGRFDIDHPLIIELIKSQPVQRLKHIHQYGVMKYAYPTEEYSRYQHSIGVFGLLKRFDRPINELIAGLLHDSSHTAFSHVGDFVFNHHSPSSSYQDDIHDWYLQKSGISSILEKYGYTNFSVNPKNPEFVALEKDLPNLCADRIEYNLQGGLLRGLITQQEFEKILNDLRFDGKVWYFTNTESAEKLADISLHMTQHVWGVHWNLLCYSWAADAIKRAVEIDLVSLDEFHFSTDDIIWHRLLTSKDPIISQAIDQVLNYKDLFELTDSEEQDFVIHGKFRGINPLVLVDKKFKPLTELSQKFKKRFDTTKAIMQEGWHIKLSQGVIGKLAAEIVH